MGAGSPGKPVLLGGQVSQLGTWVGKGIQVLGRLPPVPALSPTMPLKGPAWEAAHCSKSVHP